MSTRPPAVAGVFYPDHRDLLAACVDALLAQAHAAERGKTAGPSPSSRGGPTAKAIVAPHAAYAYSGAVAARAYEALRADATRIRRVVVLGPAHRVYLRGLALPGTTHVETPLGAIAIDPEGQRAIADLPQVIASPAAHAREHSIEVHLPFLQRLLAPGFTVVPLAVGDATPEEIAEVLERLWGGDETRFVVSSDLSHYLPYERAREVDARTAARIVAGEPVGPEDACGAFPIDGLLEVARRRGLVGQLVELKSSGDTTGPRDDVVGYGAFLFRERNARGLT